MDNKTDLKQTLTIDGLYTWIHQNDADCNQYILFVHGGPGSHSAYFEFAVNEIKCFQTSDIGWVSFDQRGCGRSADNPRALSHEGNIRDMANIIDYFETSGDLPNISAVFAHSYGVNVAFEYFRDVKPDSSLKFIMAGRSMRYDIPAKRNLMIDLSILKLFQPSDYRSLTARIGDPDLPFQEIKKTARKAIKDQTKRKLFYWGNLDRMEWYESIMDKINIGDNDDTFQKVMDTIHKNPNRRHYNPEELNQDVCWIMGMQDFLMGGDSVMQDDKSGSFRKLVYPECGHYPHFESSEKFINDIQDFLDGS